MHPRDICLGFAAAFIWGTTYVVTAAALEQTPPIFFAVLRFLGAAALIVVVPRPAVHWRTILVLGLVLGAGQVVFLFVAMAAGVPAGTVSILNQTQAVMTVALAALLLGERISTRQALAFVLALVGLVVLAFARDAAPTGLAFVFGLISAAFGAAGNLLLRRAASTDPVRLAVWMSLVPPLPLLALSFVIEGPESIAAVLVHGDARLLGAVLYSSLLATAVAFGIWGRLFSRYSAAQVGPFLLLVPTIGLASSVTLLGETLSMQKIWGIVCVLAGVSFAVLRRPAARY